MLIRKALLHGDTVLTHVSTQHGHVVKFHAENMSLMIAHDIWILAHTLEIFESSDNFFSTHWPTHPDGLGLVVGDFNTCEPEVGGFHATVHTFSPDGDTGWSPFFFFSVDLSACSGNSPGKLHEEGSRSRRHTTKFFQG